MADSLYNKSFSTRLSIAFLVVVAVGGLVYSVFLVAEAAWYDSSWDYRQKITIDSTQVDSDVSDFPVYVDLSDMSSGFFSNVNSDCGDIRVTVSDATTEVSREIVSCDTASSTGELHFKASSLSSSSDTEFYIYYGNSNASDYAETDTYGAQNVWANGYVAVYHFESQPLLDSTENNNDATTTSSAVSTTTGTVGGAFQFDGSNDLDIPDSESLDVTSELTLSTWIKTNDFDSNDQTGIMNREDYQSGGYAFLDNGQYTDQVKFRVNESSTDYDLNTPRSNVNDDTWHYLLGAVDDNGDMVFDVDNTQEGSKTGVNIASDSRPLTFGNGISHVVEQDEARVATVHRSDAWRSAQYTNLSSPTTFYTTATEENKSSTIVTDTTVSPQPVDSGNDVTFSVDWNDDEGDPAKVYVCKTDAVTAGSGCDGGTWASSSSFAQTDPKDVTYTTQTTDEGTNDYYAFACDDTGSCSTSLSGSFAVADKVVETIKADGSGDYQTISAWESATDGDLVANNKVYVGKIADTSTYDETVTLDASSTDSSFYRRLTVASSSRHDGTAGSGPVVNPSSSGDVFTVNEDHLQISWLEVTGWSGESNEGFDVNNTGFTLDHAIVHDAESGNNQADGVYFGSNQTATIANSVFYDIGRTALHIQSDQDTTINVRNVTAYNIGTTNTDSDYPAIGFDTDSSRDNSGSVFDIKNTTAHHSDGSLDAFHGGAQGGTIQGDYNASHDSSAPGSNSLTNVTQSDQFQSLTDGSEDFHLQSDASLVDAGTDLGSDYDTDIDGGTRSGTWDIGADEASLTVTTDSTSNIGETSASSTGSISSTGGATPDERGFVYSTSSYGDPGDTSPANSSYENSVSETGSFSTGSFTDSLTDLSASTTYYVRAYAHNSNGYDYGSELSFTTVNEVVDIIKADGSGDYQTISAWESATDGDLVGNNKRYIGKIADTSTYDELVTLDASSTDSTYYRKLTVASSSRHDGTAGSGPVVNPSSSGDVFTINEDYFQASWLEVTGWSGSSNEGFDVNNTGFTLDHAIVHDAESGDQQADGVYLTSDITITIANTIFYDIGRTAIHIQNEQDTTVNVKNVTAYNIVTTAPSDYPAIGYDEDSSYDNSGSVINAENTTVHASGTRKAFNESQGGSLQGDYNASDDSTAPGSNSLTNVTQSDQFQSLTDGSEDLHLQSDASLVDAGTDLGSDYDTDIDGGTRSGTWDIGADEFLPPSIVSVSDTPDPVTAGDTITFDVNWDDSDSDKVKTYICKTDAVTGGSGCDGGTWASSSSSFSSTDPQSSNYTTNSDDVGNQEYYAFACDTESACSSSTQETFEVVYDTGTATSSSDVGGGSTINGGSTIR